MIDTPLYHFTSTLHLPHIIEDGGLRPGEANLSMFRARAGVDVVWLMDTPTVDFPHGLDGSSVDKTEIRFTVEVPGAIKWTEWAWTHRMDGQWRQTLIDCAGGPEAAEHWWVYPSVIRKHRWLAIHNVKAGTQIFLPEEVK